MSRDESVLRDVTEADQEAVLALNHDHVQWLAPMDRDRLTALQAIADRVQVVVDPAEPERVAGFVITFGPGAPYDSPNYAWLRERLGHDFYYLDRVVIAPHARRRGLAGRLYDEVEAAARDAGHRTFALEVNVEPPNHASLAFHTARGFEEIGRLTLDEEPVHTVGFMTKPL